MSADPPDRHGRKQQNDAWGAFGLLVSGVAVWGGVGWLLSSWLENRLPLLLGLLVGTGAALYLVWLRYGKP